MSLQLLFTCKISVCRCLEDGICCLVNIVAGPTLNPGIIAASRGTGIPDSLARQSIGWLIGSPPLVIYLDQVHLEQLVGNTPRVMQSPVNTDPTLF